MLRKIVEELVQSPQAKNSMCTGREKKCHLQGPEDAAFGRKGGCAGRLHMSGGLRSYVKTEGSR